MPVAGEISTVFFGDCILHKMNVVFHLDPKDCTWIRYRSKAAMSQIIALSLQRFVYHHQSLKGQMVIACELVLRCRSKSLSLAAGPSQGQKYFQRRLRIGS